MSNFFLQFPSNGKHVRYKPHAAESRLIHIEIFNNSLQHVSWNSDFSLDIFLQSLNCWRIVLVNSGFQVTPEEVVWGSEIWGIRGPWVVRPPRN